MGRKTPAQYRALNRQLRIERQQEIDYPFGLLASLVYNANFTGERKSPADFFPSLKEAEHAPVHRRPRSKEEAREMGRRNAQRLMHNMRSALESEGQ